MDATIIPFRPNRRAGVDVNRRTGADVRKPTSRSHPRPLTFHVAAGLYRSLLHLDPDIQLPDANTLEKWLRTKPYYRLENDCPEITQLNELQQANLLYDIIESAHNGWVQNHSEEFFSRKYRQYRALFLPLPLIGELGFSQYLSDDFLDTFQKLSLDKGMIFDANGTRTYPHLEQVRIDRRKLYCKRHGLDNLTALRRHIANCNSLPDNIQKALSNDRRLVSTMARDVVAYDPGLFR